MSMIMNAEHQEAVNKKYDKANNKSSRAKQNKIMDGVFLMVDDCLEFMLSDASDTAKKQRLDIIKSSSDVCKVGLAYANTLERTILNKNETHAELRKAGKLKSKQDFME